MNHPIAWVIVYKPWDAKPEIYARTAGGLAWVQDGRQATYFGSIDEAEDWRTRFADDAPMWLRPISLRGEP